MIMKKIIFFIAIAISFSCISCDKNDESKVAVSLKSNLIQFAQPGNKLTFDFHAYSLYSTLKQFSIVSSDTENGTQTLVEITPDVAKYDYTFVYDVPSFSKDSMLVTLTIKAVDYDNNAFQLKCPITIVGGAQLLPEMTGIVMYSTLSGKPDAFSLQDVSQVFLRTLADSTKVDVYDYAPDIDSMAISREWRTKTNVYFAKANNFNYPMATVATIKSSFQSSISGKSINQLAINDIILFNQGDIYGVIQITDIADNEDTNNDYYRFNVKISIAKKTL